MSRRPGLQALAAVAVAVTLASGACSDGGPAGDAQTADPADLAADAAGAAVPSGSGGSDAGASDDGSAAVGDDPDGAPAYGPDPADSASSTPAGEGGSLLLLSWQPPSTANPYLANGHEDLLAASLVLEPLAEIDPDGQLIPVLAAQLPSRANGGISHDFTQVTWTLRDDVVWADGSPLTSADVEFSFAFCSAEASGCTADFSGVESVQAVGDTEVTITFAEPRPWPFDVFVGYFQPIISKAQFASCIGPEAQPCETQNFAPIGTGPFAFSEFVRSDFAGYELNPRYRGIPDGKPFFGSAVLTGGGSATEAARSILEIGEADYAWNLQVEPALLAEMESVGNGRLLASDVPARPSGPVRPGSASGARGLSEPGGAAEDPAAEPIVAGLASAVHESIGGVDRLNPWDSEFWNIEDWFRR